MGLAVGGSFGADGWTVTGAADRVVYVLPRLVEGSVEFTMTNVTMGNLVVNDNELFAMYDGYGLVEPIGYNPSSATTTTRSRSGSTARPRSGGRASRS
jgi:hypothetical protein